MKIKLPFTEEFLWDFHKVIEKIGDMNRTLFPQRWDEAGNPDLRWIRRNYQKKLGRRKFSRLIYYLKKNKYLKENITKEKGALMLTTKGEKKVFKIRLKLLEKKKRKDGKWIMLLFDIPEERRGDRDHFREELKRLGFKFIQLSIWATPYDILKEIKSLISRYYLGKHVKILLVEEIEI